MLAGVYLDSGWNEVNLLGNAAVFFSRICAVHTSGWKIWKYTKYICCDALPQMCHKIDQGNVLKYNAEFGAPGAFIWTFLDDCDHSFQCLSEEERDRHESKRETGRRQWDRMALTETEAAQPSRALSVCVFVWGRSLKGTDNSRTSETVPN